jgi:hypothetical protein
MRNLVTHSEFPNSKHFGPGCRLLTEIHVTGEDGSLGNEWVQRLMALVDNNPGLNTLQLTTDHYDFLISDLKLLRRLPGLKDLGLKYSKIEWTTTLEELLACGPKLERLEYSVTDRDIDMDSLNCSN